MASSRYERRDAFALALAVQPPLYLTDIHQVRLGTDAMVSPRFCVVAAMTVVFPLVSISG